jgi:hypothetical protein
MLIRIARATVVGLIGLLASACAMGPSTVYDLSKYGSDTAALQKALDACAAGGGGIVSVPPGRYVIGSVQIHSNTTLRLSDGAVLVGSPNASDYPIIPVRFEGETVPGHRALIYAENAQRVAITGGGTLAGDPNLGYLRNPRGPCMVELVGCKYVQLSDFTDTYRRMWSIHLLNCQSVEVSGLTIRTTLANADGIDVDSSQGVRIRHCDIDSGDDCVALKSGRGAEAVRDYQPTQEVQITDCKMGSGFSAIGIGTEMSAGISDIWIQNITITHGDCGIYIKSRTGRGGYFKKISADNITATNVKRFLGIDTINKGIVGTEPVSGLAGIPASSYLNFSNVNVSNCQFLVDATHISPAKPLDKLRLSNFTGSCDRGIALANMTNVELSGIDVKVAHGPVIAVRNVQGAGLAAAAFVPEDVEDLQSQFVEPPDNTRIQVRWWWFGPAVTHDELEREMLAMKAGGIGGFEVQPTYPLALDGSIPGLVNLKFLSPEFFDALQFAAAKAKELGLRMDLTLGSGWPYGGPMFSIDEAAGRIRASASQNLRDGEKVVASLPSGSGETTYFIEGHTGMKVKRPAYGAEGYVIDHLSADVVDKFIKEIAQKEVSACGPNVPYSVFCDSLEVAGEDWTSNFLSEFKQRRGYDLTPLLPALFGDIGPKTKDVRRDWGLTLTELFNDNFASRLQDFAHANGTRFRMQAYGSPSAGQFTYANVDLPEGEGWQWHGYRQTRYATSACHLLGDPVASSETFTWIHSPAFRATPLDIKSEADLHFLQGVNQIVCHGWPYTAAGVPDPGWSFYAAGVFDEKNPWYIVMPDVAKYLQRVSFMMRQGKPANDVLLYLSNNDAWANFTPGHISLTDGVGQCLGPRIVGAILDSGHNLDFFDDEMLALRGKVTGNTISFGNVPYRVVILAGVERMPIETLKKLQEFAANGGIVIATRRLPEIAPGHLATDQDQAALKNISRELFEAVGAPGIFVQDETELAAVLNDRLAPDVSFSPAAPEIGFVHRHTDDGEIYFLANTSNHPVHGKVTFRDAFQHAENWNPITGDVSPAGSALDLAPYASTIVMTTNRRLSASPTARAEAQSPQSFSSGWSIRFGDSGNFVPMESLHSWTDDPSTRFFSGVATYRNFINISADSLGHLRQLRLDFGDSTPAPAAAGGRSPGYHVALNPPIREAAVIYVNGHRAGSLWCPPYSLDIAPFLKAGDNEIRIDVANTAINELAEKGFPNYDYEAVVKKYGNRFQPQDPQDVQPVPSGLLGKIELVAVPR